MEVLTSAEIQKLNTLILKGNVAARKMIARIVRLNGKKDKDQKLKEIKKEIESL